MSETTKKEQWRNLLIKKVQNSYKRTMKDLMETVDNFPVPDTREEAQELAEIVREANAEYLKLVNDFSGNEYMIETFQGERGRKILELLETVKYTRDEEVNGHVIKVGARDATIEYRSKDFLDISEY